MTDIYHYLSLNGTRTDEYRRDLIAKRRIYFSDPSTFDDTFDCSVPGWESARSMLHECRVFCLSMKERDDNLMFAHYGDCHRGIRLRFSINENLPIGECTHLANGRPVEYVKKLPPYKGERPHMLYYYKSVSWAYQKEYRVLSKSEYGEYNESELTEIALGMNFDMTHLQNLAEWIQEGGHLNVKFIKAICGKSIKCF
jgi:hypothetical protein